MAEAEVVALPRPAEVEVPVVAKDKPVRDSVRSILDRISARPAGKGEEADRLRRMAEAVRKDIVTQDMVRSVGEAVEGTPETELLDGNVRSVDPAAAQASRKGAGSSSVDAYAAQKQAYLDN